MAVSKSVIVAGLAVCSAGSSAWAQFAPTSWTRTNAGYSYARDFTFDGGGGGFGEDSFTQSGNAPGSWSTSPTAIATHGIITSTAKIEQSSVISSTELSTSGSMKLTHGKPPSLSAAASYGRVRFIVAFTVANATEVAIDFSYTSSIGSTGAINAYQCLFGLSSNTGLEAYAGDAEFSPPASSFSYQGLMQPGNYELSMDVLVDEIAEGNFRQEMSWEYGWDMSVKAVPAPGTAVIGLAMLGATTRRRRA
jgi:hypothetical protein